MKIAIFILSCSVIIVAVFGYGLIYAVRKNIELKEEQIKLYAKQIQTNELVIQRMENCIKKINESD